MTTAVICFLCGIIGFVAGFLVTRNNYRTIEEKIEELKDKVDEVTTTLKK